MLQPDFSDMALGPLKLWHPETGPRREHVSGPVPLEDEFRQNFGSPSSLKLKNVAATVSEELSLGILRWSATGFRVLSASENQKYWSSHAKCQVNSSLKRMDNHKTTRRMHSSSSSS